MDPTAFPLDTCIKPLQDVHLDTTLLDTHNCRLTLWTYADCLDTLTELVHANSAITRRISILWMRCVFVASRANSVKKEKFMGETNVGGGK